MPPNAFTCIYCLSCSEITLSLHFLLCQGYTVPPPHASLYANAALNSYVTSLQGFESKTSNKLVITSVAFQDHITRSLLHPNFSLSDPLLRLKRNAHRAKRSPEERVLQGQDQQEEREYVLDPAPPPLTLGKMITIGNSMRFNLYNLGYIAIVFYFNFL